MKTRFSWAIMIFAALLLFSCKKDDDSSSVSEKTKDPEGTVTVNIRHDTGDSHVVYSPDGGYVYLSISESNNICPYYNAMIVSLGKGNNLGSININTLPTNGWTNQSAAIVGNLYIVRYDCLIGGNQHLHYIGLQVQSELTAVTNGGIVGYKIKYCPFTPGKGWNQ